MTHRCTDAFSLLVWNLFRKVLGHSIFLSEKIKICVNDYFSIRHQSTDDIENATCRRYSTHKVALTMVLSSPPVLPLFPLLFLHRRCNFYAHLEPAPLCQGTFGCRFEDVCVSISPTVFDLCIKTNMYTVISMSPIPMNFPTNSLWWRPPGSSSSTISALVSVFFT